MHSGAIVTKRRPETQTHPWTEVDDILFLILEKLEWVDRIRATTVCKKWLEQMTKIPYQGKIPWLFTYKFDNIGVGCKVKLTDESSKRSYIIESGEHLDGAVRASKFGWTLLVSTKRRRTTRLFKFFVYCPFNCNLIKLPTFSRDVNSPTYPSKDYTFSSNPTLPDCVFFAIFGYSESQRMEIRTCKIGDKKWTCFEINLSIPYVRFSVECINGLLYVVLLCPNSPNVEGDPVLNSHLGTFDPESQEWKLINEGFMKSNGKKVEPLIPDWCLFPVVYNNKELYLVRRIADNGAWEFFKYEMEEKQWVEQPSLGNRVLFIGISSFLVEAVGKLSYVANSVFLDYESPCYPFSFSSGNIEYRRKFYVDDRRVDIEVDDWMFYQRAWIMPTI